MHYLLALKQCSLVRREDVRTAGQFFFRQFPFAAERRGICCIVFVLILLSALFIACPQVQAAQAALKLTPQTPDSALKKLKNSDMVELASGKRISMATIRKFAAISKKLAGAPKIRKPLPKSLQYQPKATGILIHSLSDLSANLQKDDSTTIQLPSGRVATVGQIKFLQPLLEKRLGRKLSQFKGQSRYQGSAIQLKPSTDKDYWKNILTKPDDTLLETPKGGRFTVGEMKKYLESALLSRGAHQLKSTQGGVQ